MTPFGRPLVTFDRVGSTMDVAASLARGGAREGTCVVAGYQDAGRGRANRAWSAPPGTALLCSVILRPENPLRELTPMAILTADAIAIAVEALTGLQPRIKWPNDLLVNGRKLAGVLIQTSASGGGLVMIVGIGLNANIPSDKLEEGATSLLVENRQAVDLVDMRQSILYQLERHYRALADGGMEPSWNDLQRKLAMRGERVTVVNGDREIAGTLRGIDADGSLQLDKSGKVIRIVSGDLVRGPRMTRGR